MWLLTAILACDVAPPGGASSPADSSPVASSPVDSSPGEEPVEFDATYDVIVVGSGPAGAAAAIEAEAAGASVILFERETTPGFGVRLAGQALGVDTIWQAEVGAVDSLELAQADWLAVTGVEGTRESVTAYLTASNDVLLWLESRGVTIRGPSGAAPEGHINRSHTLLWPGGASPYEVLTAGTSFIERLGVEVTGPVLSDGEVVGVTWRDVVTGETGATGARGGVVVATGGFLRNREAVEEVRPELSALGPVYETQPSSTGGGLPFFEAVGAGRDEPQNIGVYLHAVPDPRHPDGEAMILMSGPSYILVDARGQRFTEKMDPGAYAVIENLPDSGVWLVAGVDGATGLVFSPPAFNWTTEGLPEVYTVGDLQALGSDAVVIDSDLTTAAVVMGLDPAVVETVEAYNAVAASSQLDEFGASLAPSDVVEGPKWAVVQIRPGLAKNFGGVLTDSSSRVLAPDGTPIPGIWAAGECVGMIPGGGSGAGFSGSASALYHGGRLAGAGAAARSLSAP